MKKFLPTLLMFFILAGLIAYVLLFESGSYKGKDAPVKIVLQDLFRDEIATVKVEREFDEYLMVFRDGKWLLTEPVDARTSAGPVDALLGRLCDFRAKRKLIDELERPEQYGFDIPMATITTITTDGKEHVLVIGGRTPMDEDYYIMRGGDEAVYVASGFDVNPVVVSHEEVRDRSVAEKFENEYVTSLYVTDGLREVSCLRNRGEKTPEVATDMKTPEVATDTKDAAAGDKIKESAGEAVKKTPAEETEETEMKAQVVVTEKKTPAVETVDKAQPGKSEAVADAQTAPEKQLPEWSFEDRPETDCAAEAKTLLEALTFLEASGFVDEQDPDYSKYGLDYPAYILTLTAGEEIQSFEIGAEGSATGEVYLRNAQRNEIYLVEGDFINKLETLKIAASKL